MKAKLPPSKKPSTRNEGDKDQASESIFLSPPEFSLDSISQDDSENSIVMDHQSHEGQKLSMSEDVQARMETHFNADLSKVSITKDSQMADSMNARAFAYGNEVHFGSGQYRPDTPDGAQLMKHELTHVLQQRKARVGADSYYQGVPVNRNASLENEADRGGEYFSGEQLSSNEVASPVIQGNFFDDAWDVVQDTGEQVWSGASDLWDDVSEGVNSIIDGLSESAAGVWNQLSGIGQEAWSQIEGLGSSVLEKLAGLGSTTLRWIISLGGDIRNNLRMLAGLIDNGLDYTLDLIKRIVRFGAGMAGQVLSKLLRMTLSAGHWALQILTALVRTIKKMGSKALQLIYKFAEQVENGVLQVLQIVQNIGEAFFRSAQEVYDMFFPKGTQVGVSDIPSTHMIYEYFAHAIAYRNYGSSLVGNDAQIMTAAGFEPNSISWEQGNYGLQMVSIKPKAVEGARPDPMLAFRGTYSVQGVNTDFDFIQVGQRQYYDNVQKINSFAGRLGGVMDVMGHSLGGAMAQIFTANNASKVSECVTFNAPGISSTEIAKFNRSTAGMDEDQRPEVTHHVATNDIVSAAGEMSLAGDVYRHENDNNGNPIEAHTNFFFNNQAFDQWRKDLGIQKEYQSNVGISNNVLDIERYASHPQQLLRVLLEPGRKFVAYKGYRLGVKQVLWALKGRDRHFGNNPSR